MTLMSVVCGRAGTARPTAGANQQKAVNVRLWQPHSSSKPCTRRLAARAQQDRSAAPLAWQHLNQHAQQQQQQRSQAGAPSLLVRLQQLGGAITLAAIWLLAGRPAPATAAVRVPPVQLETMVAMTPQAAAVASMPGSNDSMLMIVAVCLAFWTLSATISAAIGVLMKITGRSPQSSGSRGPATWTSAGIMDTFDIMRLPLAYEVEEPSRAGNPSSSNPGGSVTYLPWEGPAAYIPIGKVKVLRPGRQEAGLVARPALLRPEHNDNLTIISVDSSGRASSSGGDLLPPRNGNGNGNGNSNGNGNGSGSGNGNGNGNGNGKGKPVA